MRNCHNIYCASIAAETTGSVMISAVLGAGPAGIESRATNALAGAAAKFVVGAQYSDGDRKNNKIRRVF